MQETYVVEDCVKYGITNNDTWHNIKSPNVGSVTDGVFSGYNKMLDFDMDWSKDWEITVDFKQNNYRVGLIICDETMTTSYDTSRYAILNNGDTEKEVFEGKNASNTLVIDQQITKTISYSTFYTIKVVKQGISISAYIDGTLIGTGTEMGLINTANIGVYSWNNITGHIKNLKVKAL